MSPDLLERLHEADPVRGETTTPPSIEPLLARLRADSPTVGHRRAPRRTRALTALALFALASTLGFALVDGGGDSGQFDVAAAVYHALQPGHGVLYIDVEEHYAGKPAVTTFQYWSTAHPLRQRSLVHVGGGQPRQLERVLPAGGTWSYWSSTRPEQIFTTNSKRVEPRFDASFLLAAYRNHLLRMAGRTSFGGEPAYRLLVVHPPGTQAPPVEVLVAAHTFVPLQIIDYAHDHDGNLKQGWILSYRAYEEVPASAANLALLKMAPHPGARPSAMP